MMGVDGMADPKLPGNWTQEEHVRYPHLPGALYDCVACEAQCFCAELNRGQVRPDLDPIVCVHCAIQQERNPQ